MLTIQQANLASPMPVFQGFGATNAELTAIAAQLAMLSTEGLDQWRAIRAAMESLPSDDVKSLANKLLALGVDPVVVAEVKGYTLNPRRLKTGVMIWGILGTASMAASAYHGYKRNNSIGWALVWGFFGAIAPVITPAIAIAQNFGKPKRRR